MSSQTGTFGRGTTVAILAILGIALVCGVPASATSSRDYGDAPEGALAYPSSGVVGQFPTCTSVGPAAWIEHNGRSLYFGAKVDMETDGNGGQCPTFEPSTYDQDEKFNNDGDAGLLKPRAYSIKNVSGTPTVYPLVTTGLETIANACMAATWGVNIDITVHNDRTDGQPGYVNLLIDWNQDGKWGGSSPCEDQNVPEHILVNFPVPAGYSGPLSGLSPKGFTVGPYAGYVWARFSITEQPVRMPWTGDGAFSDGETEDYLLSVLGALPEPCSWTEGDPDKMHWPQLPDLRSTTGLAVSAATVPLADDFLCTGSGPITDIHFWGAFRDGVVPPHGSNAVAFTIGIYSNVPPDEQITWSRPGQLLWSKKVEPYTYDVSIAADAVTQGWYDPNTKSYDPANLRRTYLFNICLDSAESRFVQTYGTTYWLYISAVADPNYAFGWTIAQNSLQWNDCSAWRHKTYDWLPMTYPDTHPYQSRSMDMAFVINSAPDNQDFGDAPDPPYPTVSSTDGACHTIDGLTYLGRGVDAEADGQSDATATGDDASETDDEDGVVFTSDLVPGETVTVEVTASTVGALNAWIDFNGDGDWDDKGEHVFIDTTLMAGVNTLAVSVPADATPGRAFSRWRFSTERGLRYTGSAPDGEVEDYMLTITGDTASVVPVMERLKWSQPALEQDPLSITPAYIGWNEPAYVSKASDTATATWKVVADDFRCVGTMPVSSVHWWGSYQRWSDMAAPSVTPQSWRIAFWSNVAADGKYTFSRPGNLLWVITVPARRVTEQWVGVDEFPSVSAYQEACFSYSAELESLEYFWQDNYASSTTDSIFWMSITAVYSGGKAPDYPWGWQTRPKNWRDTAVTFSLRQKDLTAGTAADAFSMTVLSSAAVCQQWEGYGMAFELNTDPAYVKWEQAFTGLRHWAYYEDVQSGAASATAAAASTAKWTQNPDLTATGIDIDATADTPRTWPNEIAADDFQCTTTGPITRITVWGSWYGDIPPTNDAAYVTFTLTLRDDVPAGQGATHYSMPGKILWQKEFTRAAFTVQQESSQTQSYYSPSNATYEQSNHRSVYKYVFDVDSQEAFQQTGSTAKPVVYWLSVQASVLQIAGTVATRFGWQSSSDHWNDSGTWVGAAESYSGSAWQQLLYPSKHTYAGRSVDLAFAIETQESGGSVTYQQIAADDWQCAGATPVTGFAWWGSYLGYEYQPGACEILAAPRRPDHFLLSIWSNVPDTDLTNSRDFSHPGEKLWEYQATDFDEVMVGSDKKPDVTEFRKMDPEPVYRYSVRLPRANYFWQRTSAGTYWLSIAAVYKDAKTMVYPWGWTNHEFTTWGGSGLKPLAYWKFDESSGATASDSSGNGNDGTIVGNPTWQPTGGRVGGALDFDGRSYVKVDQATNLNFAPGSFSVSTWVYPREVSGRPQALVEYDRTTTSGNRFGLWITTNGRFQFRVGGTTATAQQSLKSGAWYLVTGIYDSSTRQLSLYVNGQLDRTAGLSSGYGTPTVAQLTIGVRGTEDTEFFNGLLDDMRLYGAALTAENILSLYHAANNDNAVVGTLNATTSTWQWTQLFDETGQDEDLSFVLFTEPQTTTSAEDGEVIFTFTSGDTKK